MTALCVLLASLSHDVRLRTDYLHLTAEDPQVAGQLVGYGLRLRAEYDRFGVHFDGRAREDLLRANGTRRSIAEARASVELGRFSIEVGRIPFGEGAAMLLVDGGAATVRWQPWFTQALALGVRGEFEDLTPDRDRPTVATSVNLRGDHVETSGSVSVTGERAAPSGRDHDERQYQVANAAGRVLWLPSTQVWVFASGEAADFVAWALPADDPRSWTIDPEDREDSQASSSRDRFPHLQAYGQVGYRPWKPLRLDTSYVYLASRFASAGNTEHFQDVATRVRWRALRDVRLMVRARFRLRERLVIEDGAQSTTPDRALRLQGGVDVHDIADTGLAATASGMFDRGERRQTIHYAADAGHRGPWWSALVGWRSTLRDVDDDFGPFAARSDVAALDPYSRSVQTAVTAQASVFHGAWDAHASGDYDLETQQAMVFAQTSVRWR